MLLLPTIMPLLLLREPLDAVAVDRHNDKANHLHDVWGTPTNGDRLTYNGPSFFSSYIRCFVYVCHLETQ